MAAGVMPTLNSTRRPGWALAGRAHFPSRFNRWRGQAHACLPRSEPTVAGRFPASAFEGQEVVAVSHCRLSPGADSNGQRSAPAGPD